MTSLTTKKATHKEEKKKNFKATNCRRVWSNSGVRSRDHLITGSFFFFKGDVSELTYCACCVENFKHTLLAVYLHLL